MGREGHDDVNEVIKSLILNGTKLCRPIFRPNHLNGLTGKRTSHPSTMRDSFTSHNFVHHEEIQRHRSAEGQPRPAVAVMAMTAAEGMVITTMPSRGCSSSQPYVALKPIAEGMGLDWEAQRKRLARDAVLSSVASMTEATGRDGRLYQMTVLPLRYLNGFLFGINAKQAKAEIRDGVIAAGNSAKDQKGLAAQALTPHKERRAFPARTAKRPEKTRRINDFRTIAGYSRREYPGGAMAGRSLSVRLDNRPTTASCGPVRPNARRAHRRGGRRSPRRGQAAARSHPGSKSRSR